MNAGDPYLIPGTSVLRNKLGITEALKFDYAERELVTQRIIEGIPEGCFDLVHLQAIHRHLFQDIYEWAGAVRTVEIAKGGHQFQFRQFIATGMGDVHRRLAAQNFLRGLRREAFAQAAGTIMGDVNYVHSLPRREWKKPVALSRSSGGAGGSQAGPVTTRSHSMDRGFP